MDLNTIILICVPHKFFTFRHQHKPIIWWYKRWYIFTKNITILALARDKKPNVADSLSAINRHFLIFRLKMDLLEE